MLVEGFFVPVLEEIAVDELREDLDQLIYDVSGSNRRRPQSFPSTASCYRLVFTDSRCEATHRHRVKPDKTEEIAEILESDYNRLRSKPTDGHGIARRVRIARVLGLAPSRRRTCSGSPNPSRPTVGQRLHLRPMTPPTRKSFEAVTENGDRLHGIFGPDDERPTDGPPSRTGSTCAGAMGTPAA